MITQEDLSGKLIELNAEYRKIISAGKTAEAFRWLVSAADFLETLIEEARMLGDLTEGEKKELDVDSGMARNAQQYLKRCLSDRIEKENRS